ncbi:hypothetical protein SLEP1_g56426 [Rubroshorea leprosula]|uniref:Uncharacterized protein n=1 Tax=Rubroshorea leprosula TaxID=152421 RepID=A0AAV5MI98_9ROSI|nr:hypothetical protein SLEP1_g56426 [Rubroshorea leprosula]
MEILRLFLPVGWGLRQFLTREILWGIFSTSWGTPTVKFESVLPASLQLSLLTVQLTAALGPCCPATHRSPLLPFSFYLSPCNSPQPLALAALQLTAHLQLSSKTAAGSSQPASHRGTLPSARHCKSAPLTSSSSKAGSSDNNGNFFNLFEELEENDNEDDEFEDVISST